MKTYQVKTYQVKTYRAKTYRAKTYRAKTYRAKTFISVVTATILAFCFSALAQNPNSTPRIGHLIATSDNPGRINAFRHGLRDLGYVEGKNIIIEWRHGEGKLDRLPALAAELVRLNVDVIVSAGPPDTRAAKQATDKIPIVMTQDADPVGSGFVASLARPGGNITGLSTLAPELSGKRLELLKEIVPNLSRLAVFGTSTQPGNALSLKEVEIVAKSFKVEIQYLDVLSGKDIEGAFQVVTKGRHDAILMLIPGRVAAGYQTAIAELAVKNRLPAMYHRADFVEAGGLMTYGVNIEDLDRRAATYVDRILKGAKPADLPVEQPTKFELLINLKTAKQIGLTIPPNVLARADRVIK